MDTLISRLFIAICNFVAVFFVYIGAGTNLSDTEVLKQYYDVLNSRLLFSNLIASTFEEHS